jgi:peptidoglycan hydrolase CwlO-like protein
MIYEIISALGIIVLGVLGYILGYWKDKDQTKMDKYEKIIVHLEKQLEQVQNKMKELEDKLDADRVKYQTQIEHLQKENLDLKIKITRFEARCKGCLDE